jgi:hypothetical protein
MPSKKSKRKRKIQYNLSAPDNGLTSFVFRSVVTVKPWDCFVPVATSDTSGGPSHPQFILRSCGSSIKSVTYEDHINMGWNHRIRSPYISFSSDVNWSIYYQLKHEHITMNKKNSTPTRQLYALEVISDDVISISNHLLDTRAKYNALSAKELLGTLQVRIVRKLSITDVIPTRLRKTSLEWFQQRDKDHKVAAHKTQRKYPFSAWIQSMIQVCQHEFLSIEHVVEQWKSDRVMHPKLKQIETIVNLSHVCLDERTPLLPVRHSQRSLPSPVSSPSYRHSRDYKPSRRCILLCLVLLWVEIGGVCFIWVTTAWSIFVWVTVGILCFLCCSCVCDF